MKRLLPFPALLFLLLLSSCSSLEIVTGGLYSVREDETSYTVAKVLAYEDTMVHLRVYRNVFPERPESIDTSKLYLGSIEDTSGFGIPHVALTEDEFITYAPELIMVTTVKPDELTEYNQWKQERRMPAPSQ